MIDLDAIDRVTEIYREQPDPQIFVGIYAAELAALIAELRASRKVVEAARLLNFIEIDGHEVANWKAKDALDEALAELSSINDVITEGK